MNNSVSSFDLDAYAARYHGRGKIQRLRFIAERSPELHRNALGLALAEAQRGRDTSLYKDIIEQAAEPLGDDCALDQAWVRSVDQWATKELEKLRHELEDCKLQANKEVICTGHNDLGDFFHKRGRLQQARVEYLKTRDYCMHTQHALETYLKIIVVSIEAGEYSQVETHYMMADNTPDVNLAVPDMAKMRACAGLALLVRGAYEQAADRFLHTSTETREEGVAQLQFEFGDVMSLEDVATYGGLCALATKTRAQLAKDVLERAEFRNLLELVPDTREMIVAFHNTRYTRCLALMRKLRSELSLDRFLGAADNEASNHVDCLFRMIRQKAIVQYVSPFVTADLRRMRSVFDATAEELEGELVALIERGDIRARIDSQGQALHATRGNVRGAVIASSLSKGQDAFDDVEALLLRMTLMKNNMFVSVGGAMNRGSTGLTHRRSISSVADGVFDAQVGD